MGKYANEILNLINSSDNHMTAEQVFFELKKSQPKIVLASVYNNLNRLSEQGSIRKICMDGEADRYDKTDRHYHLVCRRCGRLADFGFQDLTALFEKQLRADVIGYDLKVFYVCPECKNKK